MQEDPVGHGNLRHGCEHAGPKCHLHSMGQETQQITSGESGSLAGETWNPTSFKNPLNILGRIFRSDLRGPKARNNGLYVVIHIYIVIYYTYILIILLIIVIIINIYIYTYIKSKEV